MKSFILTVPLYIFLSCGQIDQTTSNKNLRSTFAVSDLSALSENEVLSATSLCNALESKETTFLNAYISKFFNYESSIKVCDSDQSSTKNISLALTNSLNFSASSDSNYAFLTPELSNNNSTFSKFCQNNFNSRYILSSNEVYHFSISKKSSTYEVTVVTSFYHETTNGAKTYKIYKKDELVFNAISSANNPAGVMISRVLSTTSNCTDSSQEYVKSSVLKSIVD